MSTAGLVILIVVALGFDFTNGFHDAANAVAVSITTRALRPLSALGMAAALNVVGALISTKVAGTVGKGIIATPSGTHGLVIVFAALAGGIGWNLLTWRLGLPSSSTHALVGGLVGAAVGAASTVHWKGVLEKVVLPMALSPLIGLALGYLLMLAISWIFRRANPGGVNRGFRRAQTLSKNVAIRDDELEHQVESADAIVSIHDEDEDARQQSRQQPKEQPQGDEGEEPPHIDVTG